MKLFIVKNSKLSKLVTWNSLSFSNEKINVLLGINGSGKTLLLNSLNDQNSKNIMIEDSQLNIISYNSFFYLESDLMKLSDLLFKSSGEKLIISFLTFLKNIKLDKEKLNILTIDELDKSMSINFLIACLHYLTELKNKTQNIIIIITLNTYIPNIYDLNYICLKTGNSLKFDSFDDYFNYYIKEHSKHNKGLEYEIKNL